MLRRNFSGLAPETNYHPWTSLFLHSLRACCKYFLRSMRIILSISAHNSVIDVVVTGAAVEARGHAPTPECLQDWAQFADNLASQPFAGMLYGFPVAQTLEQHVADRTAAAEKRATQLRSLTVDLKRAKHRERRRIAEVLHNHIQQMLYGVRLQHCDSVILRASPGRRVVWTSCASERRVAELQSGRRADLREEDLKLTRVTTWNRSSM